MGRSADADKLKLFQQTLEDAYQEQDSVHRHTSAQYGGSVRGGVLRRIDRDRVFLATKSPIPQALTAREAAHMSGRFGTAYGNGLGVARALTCLNSRCGTSGPRCLGRWRDVALEARSKQADSLFGLATRFHHLLETAVHNAGRSIPFPNLHGFYAVHGSRHAVVGWAAVGDRRQAASKRLRPAHRPGPAAAGSTWARGGARRKQQAGADFCEARGCLCLPSTCSTRSRTERGVGGLRMARSMDWRYLAAVHCPPTSGSSWKPGTGIPLPSPTT